MSLQVFIVIVLLGGWLIGKLFTKIKLPNILGMVLLGIFMGTFYRAQIPNVVKEIEPFLKSFAVVVILLRAGLGISKETLKKVGLSALLMSFIPCIIEGTVLTFLFHYMYNFSYSVAGLTGFMLSGVSTAVVVPSMLECKNKHYGEKRDVPTLVLAGASVDNVFVFTIFSIFLGFACNQGESILQAVIKLPISIIAGIVPGIIVGLFLVWYFKKRAKHVNDAEKILVLLTLSLMLVRVGDILHSAALLGLMTIGYILLEKQNKVARDLANKLSSIWIFAEIILFCLIGMAVDIKIAFSTGLKGIFIIFLGLIARSIGVLIATSFSNLNKKEKLFCVISYIPKATVQAALGSVALSMGLPEGNVILAIAVLSIIFTAPLGLILIKSFAPRLLDCKGK